MGSRTSAAPARLRPRVDLRDPIEAERARQIGFAWRSIRRGASAQALREYMHGSGPDALEQGEMDTLDVLVQREAWRMGDLACALKVDPSSGTRAVGRLVVRGLAERATSDSDGRVVLVRATGTGRSTHRTISKRRAIVLGHILGAFDADERAELAALLDRFAAALDDVAGELGR